MALARLPSNNTIPTRYSASTVSLASSIAASINPSSSTGTLASGGAKKQGPAVAPRRGAKKIRHVEVMYAYEARAEGELSVTDGERVVLVQPDQGDGWCEVEKGGRTGSVPASYVKEV